MRNDAVFQTKQDLNPFSMALRARCQAEGAVLVQMRNGDYCKVVYQAAHTDEYEEEAFRKEDHSAYWEMSGHSVTADRFDLVAFEGQAPASDLMTLRLEMEVEGWSSNDQVTRSGWGASPGYSIWFKRFDWHGKRAMVLTGTAATYHAHTPDPAQAFATAQKAAALARQAWREYPDCPPTQGLCELEPRKPFHV